MQERFMSTAACWRLQSSERILRRRREKSCQQHGPGAQENGGGVSSLPGSRCVPHALGIGAAQLLFLPWQCSLRWDGLAWNGNALQWSPISATILVLNVNEASPFKACVTLGHVQEFHATVKDVRSNKEAGRWQREFLKCFAHCTKCVRCQWFPEWLLHLMCRSFFRLSAAHFNVWSVTCVLVSLRSSRCFSEVWACLQKLLHTAFLCENQGVVSHWSEAASAPMTPGWFAMTKVGV